MKNFMKFSEIYLSTHKKFFYYSSIFPIILLRIQIYTKIHSLIIIKKYNKKDQFILH